MSIKYAHSNDSFFLDELLIEKRREDDKQHEKHPKLYQCSNCRFWYGKANMNDLGKKVFPDEDPWITVRCKCEGLYCGRCGDFLCPRPGSNWWYTEDDYCSYVTVMMGYKKCVKEECQKQRAAFKEKMEKVWFSGPYISYALKTVKEAIDAAKNN